jgi:hypothetical protein
MGEEEGQKEKKEEGREGRKEGRKEQRKEGRKEDEGESMREREIKNICLEIIYLMVGSHMGKGYGQTPPYVNCEN